MKKKNRKRVDDALSYISLIGIVAGFILTIRKWKRKHGRISF